MRSLINTYDEKCVGCNRCVRECPVENACVAYSDECGGVKVRVDSEKCVACGACVTVCKHEARYFVDDTIAFFSELKRGVPISLIIAPPIKTNFVEWRRVLAWLRSLGVQRIYDISLGMALSTWGNLRCYESDPSRTLFTQPCPSVVQYIEKHRPELIPHLSPLHGPMGCLAVYMRTFEGITDRIAAMSPCIATAKEFEEIGMVDMNITFAGLDNYMRRNDIVLPLEESDFDIPETPDFDIVYPAPGGPKESLRYFVDSNTRIDTVSGKLLYNLIDEFATTAQEKLPKMLVGFSCANGCDFGSACVNGRSYFDVQSRIDALRVEMQPHLLELKDRCKQYEQYDKKFALASFMRGYRADKRRPPEVTEEEIEHAFALMDKDTDTKRHYDCGACGADSCLEMARKIVLGANIPDSCTVKSRENLLLMNKVNDDLYNQNKKYVQLLHDVGEELALIDEDTYHEVMNSALGLIAGALEARRVYLWKFCEVEGNRNRNFFKRIHYRSSDNSSGIERIDKESLPEWVEAMMNGETVIRYDGLMSQQERTHPINRGIGTVINVPIKLRGSLWGAVTVQYQTRGVFRDEEVSLLAAVGTLMVSSAVERELITTLVDLREEAVAGARSKSDFLARMSHEIRTPMNAIIGMTKIAAATNDIEKLRHCFATIDASSSHLLGIINDVLDMAKIEAGKLELDSAPLELEPMMIKICNIMASRMLQKSIDFHVLLDENLRRIFIGDELRLSQVVTNLLSNAVKFTPEDGTILVYASEVAQEGPYTTVRFVVEDNGIGIEQKNLAKLFSAFEQADRGIAQQFGGTGLGLSISKSIVECMNGRIWAESEVGVGSKFIFEVDLLRGPGSFTGAQEAPGRRAHVLMVEKSAAPGRLKGGEVRRNEISVSFSTGVEEAIELIEQNRDGDEPISVLIVDYRLDDLTDSIKRLKNTEQSLKVIILAMFELWNGLEQQLRSASIEDVRFVAKPLFPSTMFEAVYSVMDDSDAAASGGNKMFSEFPGKRLLLVEDVEINREIFTTLLESSGLIIDEAENGRIGYEKFRDNEDLYDIIVMDIQMPEMTGYEATRAIRAIGSEKAKTIPIIAMTANAFREDIDACFDAGMNDHLMKPVDVDALNRKLSEYLMGQ